MSDEPGTIPDLSLGDPGDAEPEPEDDTDDLDDPTDEDDVSHDNDPEDIDDSVTDDPGTSDG